MSAAQAAPLDTFRDCDVCPEMIELPLGEFVMGAPLGEALPGFELIDGEWVQTGPYPYPFLNHREQPIHPVTIDISFAMGRNEVTYDEWMACVNDGGCEGYIPNPEIRGRMASGDIGEIQAIGTFPVVRISYLDALTFVDWLNEKTGTMTYRLPTEAEWEYAARAGTTTPFAQGMHVTKDQVNFADVAWETARASGDPSEIIDVLPVRVEELDAANAWGLRHMSGNVAEITMSCWTPQHEFWSFSSEYLRSSERIAECSRVGRGGSFFLNESLARVGARASTNEEARTLFRGFRVLREIQFLN